MSKVAIGAEKSSAKLSFRDVASNAIRYWEVRRLVYNAVLSLIVVGYFCAGLPKSWSAISVNSFLALFVLAVLANLLYCAAYIVDLFGQFSGLRSQWLRVRWLLLLIGIAFAAVITRFFAMGFFSLI